MTSSTIEPPPAVGVGVADDALTLRLADGRTVSAPLAWFPRLAHATADELAGWRLTGGGRGVHWPAMDEDISVAAVLAGRGSSESAASLSRWLAGRPAGPAPSEP